MAPSTNFIALSNSHEKYTHLKYLTPLIQSEIFPVPPSADEWGTWNTLKE